MSEYKTDKNIESIPIEVVSENDVTHTMEIINRPSGDDVEWGYVKDDDGIFVPFTIQTPEQEYYDRSATPSTLHHGIANTPTSKVTQYSSYTYFDKGKYLVILMSSAGDYAPGMRTAGITLTMNLTNSIDPPSGSGITCQQLSNNRVSKVLTKDMGLMIYQYLTCSCTTSWLVTVPTNTKYETKFYAYADRVSTATIGMTLSYSIIKLED